MCEEETEECGYSQSYLFDVVWSYCVAQSCDSVIHRHHTLDEQYKDIVDGGSASTAYPGPQPK